MNRCYFAFCSFLVLILISFSNQAAAQICGNQLCPPHLWDVPDRPVAQPVLGVPGCEVYKSITEEVSDPNNAGGTTKKIQIGTDTIFYLSLYTDLLDSCSSELCELTNLDTFLPIARAGDPNLLAGSDIQCKSGYACGGVEETDGTVGYGCVALSQNGCAYPKMMIDGYCQYEGCPESCGSTKYCTARQIKFGTTNNCLGLDNGLFFACVDRTTQNQALDGQVISQSDTNAVNDVPYDGALHPIDLPPAPTPSADTCPTSCLKTCDEVNSMASGKPSLCCDKLAGTAMIQSLIGNGADQYFPYICKNSKTGAIVVKNKCAGNPAALFMGSNIGCGKTPSFIDASTPQTSKCGGSCPKNCSDLRKPTAGIANSNPAQCCSVQYTFGIASTSGSNSSGPTYSCMSTSDYFTPPGGPGNPAPRPTYAPPKNPGSVDVSPPTQDPDKCHGGPGIACPYSPANSGVGSTYGSMVSPGQKSVYQNANVNSCCSASTGGASSYCYPCSSGQRSDTKAVSYRAAIGSGMPSIISTANRKAIPAVNRNPSKTLPGVRGTSNMYCKGVQTAGTQSSHPECVDMVAALKMIRPPH